ncbi:MAG TPA: hypothetical protein VGQ62_13410 [Chloroflexota bacterium]|nr:hypothetical protein [Chloroflexota bacterium]
MAEAAGRVSRRAWFASLVSGAGLLAAACTSPGAQVLDTPEGRVMQYEGDDLLVLVSGLQPTYQVGESVRLNLMVNNQSAGYVQVRLRTKLLGRGDQPVVQVEPALLNVKSDDATSVDQDLTLGRDLVPGEYTLSIEVPPWKLDGRDFGRGATLRAAVRLDPAAIQ